MVLAAVAGLSQFALSRNRPLSYLVFPALIWAAFRFGAPGATLSVAVTAADGWWAVGPCLLVGTGAGTVLLCLATRGGREEGHREEEKVAEST